MDYSLILTAILSGLFAGAISVAVTLAIEKFGGLVGGIMGTTPTTIIPAAIGLAIRLDSHSMRNSVFSVPMGILINAGFLAVWKFGPKLLPPAIEQAEKKRVVVLTIVSMTYWAAFAVIAVFSIRAINSTEAMPPYAFGLICVLCIVTLGFTVVWLFPSPAPKGKRKVTKYVLAARASLAGVAIAVAILLSSVNDIVGGVTTMFPAVFLTTCVSLSLSQGSAVSSGALGPMMLGSTSVASWAMLFGALVPVFHEQVDLPFPLSVFIATLIAYAFSVGCISVPFAFMLRWRARSVLSSGSGFNELDEIHVEEGEEHEHEPSHEQEGEEHPVSDKVAGAAGGEEAMQQIKITSEPFGVAMPGSRSTSL